MDEFKLLSENAFVPIEREEHKHICQLNENMTFELKETPEGGIQYVLIRNILKHPDDFVTFVKRHPAYGGKLKTYIPGFRQFFSTTEFMFLHQFWSALYKKTTGKDTSFWNWASCSNICYPGMVGDVEPHADLAPYVGSLWLMKDMPDTGTAFFKFKHDGKVYYNKHDLPKGMYETSPIFKSDARSFRSWYDLEKNERYERIYVTGSEYNTAVFYSGHYFHNTTLRPDKYPNKVRYSFLSFLEDETVRKKFQ
jgi:hypothetical protein